MGTKNNYINKVFNSLTVIGEGGRSNTGSVLWLCSCACGEQTLALAYDLREGKVKSCGCYRRNNSSNKTHGFASAGGKRSSVYSTWSTMIQRCTNEKNINWKHYGGCGVAVCERWKTFENFLMDMGDKPKGLTLDRKDNTLGYNKENCKWATRSEQARNKRNNVWITMNNKTQILTDWIKELNTSKSAVKYIMKKGFTHEEALKRIMGKAGNKKDTQG